MHLGNICFLVFFIVSCHDPNRPSNSKAVKNNTSLIPAGHITNINTGNTTPVQLIAFARTLTGVPYKYGCTDPALGFDCSGFITYVFNHFGIVVPRASVDFTDVDREIKLKDAKPGDLILFTGTDSTIRIVGHMGIIVSRSGEEVKFIHSTSGKAYSVTETPLNTYYRGRYMKIIRVFQQNDK